MRRLVGLIIKNMVRQILLILISLLPFFAAAETFDFTSAKNPLPMYNDSIGYGYESMPVVKKGISTPFFFSVKVPDGNYKVTLDLGAEKSAASTTVRAENRRLMAEKIDTRKGETKTVSFIVNKRNPRIDDKNSVSLKPREKSYLNWDNKLTVEITGEAPAVKRMTIEPADTSVTTIYLCGNSTVVDHDKEPWASWGQMIPRWFDDSVAISNHAESGSSTSTFLAHKRLDKIMTTLRPGDWVLVEFGHNDEKEKRPGSGAWYNFAHNLKIFVDRVRNAGGNIVFVTPTQRRNFMDDSVTIRDTHGDFPAAMKAAAEREGVPVIDLNQMTCEFFETLGYENSKRSLVHYPANTFPGQTEPLEDNTHFNPYGAYEIAKMVVAAMRQLELAPARHVKADFTGYDPRFPDSWEEFIWIPSAGSDIVKPDGN